MGKPRTVPLKILLVGSLSDAVEFLNGISAIVMGEGHNSRTVHEWNRVERLIQDFRPTVVVLVHNPDSEYDATDWEHEVPLCVLVREENHAVPADNSRILRCDVVSNNCVDLSKAILQTAIEFTVAADAIS